MIYDEEKIKTYLEGEKAYKDNKLITSCPYAFDSIDGELWLQGYNGVKKLVEAYESSYNFIERT